MQTTKAVTLGLRYAPGHDSAAPLLGIVDRLLDIFCQTLDSEPVPPGSTPLAKQIGEHRDALATATESAVIQRLGGSIVELCRAGMARRQEDAVNARAEIAGLLIMLRDAVSVIATAGNGFSSDVNGSVERFEALRRITDVDQLRNRLFAEVSHLKEAVGNREKLWKATVSSFEDRVAILERQLETTVEAATHDPLTGAANRRMFDAAMTHTFEARQNDSVVALFDVDNFKTINDACGHVAGDAVLVAVAAALKAAFRTDDVISRQGGDEFAVLMRGMTLPQAEARVRSIVATMAALSIEGVDRPVTMSCGVAELSAGDTFKSLIQRADQALYDAKRGGKNRVVARTPPFVKELRRG